MCTFRYLLIYSFILILNSTEGLALYRLPLKHATGQPLPEGIFKDTLPQDYRTKGIKNICTGIGLFIFLWAITDEFSIGCIGLLVMFTGIGQWIISRNQQHERPEDPFTRPTHKDETLNEQK